MSLETGIARFQKFLARLQNILHFRRSPKDYAKNRARGKIRGRVLRALHL